MAPEEMMQRCISPQHRLRVHDMTERQLSEKEMTRIRSSSNCDESSLYTATETILSTMSSGSPPLSLPSSTNYNPTTPETKPPPTWQNLLKQSPNSKDTLILHKSNITTDRSISAAASSQKGHPGAMAMSIIPSDSPSTMIHSQKQPIVMKSRKYYESPIRILEKRQKINYLRAMEGSRTAVAEDSLPTGETSPTNQQQASSATAKRGTRMTTTTNTKQRLLEKSPVSSLNAKDASTYQNSQKDRYQKYNRMQELEASSHSSHAFKKRTSKQNRLKKQQQQKKHYSDVEKYFLPLVKSNRRRNISMRAMAGGQDEYDIEWVVQKRRQDEEVNDANDFLEQPETLTASNDRKPDEHNAAASPSTAASASPQKKFRHSLISSAYNAEASAMESSLSPNNSTNLSNLLIKEYYKQQPQDNNLLHNSQHHIEYSSVAEEYLTTNHSQQEINRKRLSTTLMQDSLSSTVASSNVSYSTTLQSPTAHLGFQKSSSKSPKEAEKLRVVDMEELLENTGISFNGPLNSTLSAPPVNPWGGSIRSRSPQRINTQRRQESTASPEKRSQTSPIKSPVPPRQSTEYTSSLNNSDHSLFFLCRPLYLQPSVHYHAPDRITPNDIICRQVLHALNWSIQTLNPSTQSRTNSTREPISFPSQDYLKQLNHHLLKVRQYYSHADQTKADKIPLELQMRDIPRKVKREVLKQYNDQMMKAEAFRRSKRFSDQCLCLYNACILLDNIRQYEKSSDIYQQILYRSQKINDRIMECIVLNHLCLNYTLQFMQTRNEEHWEEAVHYGAMHLEYSDVYGQAIAHANLGLLHLLAHICVQSPQSTEHTFAGISGEELLCQCLDHYTQGLVMSYSTKQPKVQQSILCNMSLALLHGSYYSEALDLLQRLLLIDPTHLNKSISYILCGHIAQLQHKLPDAYKYYQQATSEGKNVSNAVIKELVQFAQTHMTQTKSSLLYEKHMKDLQQQMAAASQAAQKVG